MGKNKKPKYQNWKEVIIAILIGACISFLTALFDGLADFLRTNSEQIIAGGSATAYYLAKNYRV